VDFIVLDTQPVEACNSISIIAGRPFLATSNALINCMNGLMKLSFGNITLEMNIFNICKQPRDDNELQELDLIEELVYDQFESTLSKTEFDEFEELQMIYSQEEIKDKKGIDNVVADHLSKLTIDSTSDIPPINDYIPDESLLSLSPMPWFANFVNFLALGYLLAYWSTQDKRKFLNEVKNFYWDDPCLFKYCPDQIFRRCIFDNEVSSFIKFFSFRAMWGSFFIKENNCKNLTMWILLAHHVQRHACILQNL